MLSNKEELHLICPGFPSYHLYSKGSLMLINRLAQIGYIEVSRIGTSKYKESQSSSCILKRQVTFHLALKNSLIYNEQLVREVQVK